MPPRPWHLAPLFAALALTTTACAVGPTVSDSPHPAAATATLPPQSTPGMAGAVPTASNGVAAPPSGPASAAPAPSPTEVEEAFGSRNAFSFADGVNIWVERVTIVGPDGAGGGESVRIAVRVRLENSSQSTFRPHDLSLQLMACPEIGGTCQKRSGTATEEPLAVPAHEQVTMTRYFAAKRANVGGKVSLVAGYNALHQKYAGVPEG